MSGLFGTLNIGKSGLFANQQAVNVTSHNVSNANTDGYTRQRAELTTTRPQTTGGSVAGQLGTGVQVADITRVRDTFLDYQTRVETSTQGKYTVQDEYLNQVENILNEPSDTGISTLLGSFYDSWQSLSKQAETTSGKTLVAEQSKALTDELNHTYTELQTLKTDSQSNIKDAVSEINNYLNQISSLNQEIKQVKVVGQEPNDLMDSRDKLLDELSSKFGITVDKTSFDGINVSTEDGSTSLIKSLNPDTENRFSCITDIKDASGKSGFNGNGTYTVTYYKYGDTSNDANKMTIDVPIGSEAEYDALNESRVILANNDGSAVTDASGNLELFQSSSGELSGYTDVQKQIDDYTDELNNFARSLAFSVNAVYTQNDGSGTSTVPDFFVNSSTGGTEAEINAGNITVNSSILNNSSSILAGADDSGESDGSRALAIADLRSVKMEIQAMGSVTNRASFISTCCDSFNTDTTFGGLKVIQSSSNGMTMDDYFNNSIDKVGVQAQVASKMVTNQKTLLQGFQESKDSISGVSLDEETVNLIKYQRAYQANSKVISTVDDLLDVVVNGLKK